MKETKGGAVKDEHGASLLSQDVSRSSPARLILTGDNVSPPPLLHILLRVLIVDVLLCVDLDLKRVFMFLLLRLAIYVYPPFPPSP